MTATIAVHCASGALWASPSLPAPLPPLMDSAISIQIATVALTLVLPPMVVRAPEYRIRPSAILCPY